MNSMGTAPTNFSPANTLVVVGTAFVFVFLCSLGDAPPEMSGTMVGPITSVGTSSPASNIRATAVYDDSPILYRDTTPWVPKTALGRILASKRASAIAKGMALLSIEEINEMLHSSRRDL